VVPAFCYQARPGQGSGLLSKGKHTAAAPDERAVKSEKTAYDYNLPGADGKDVPLSTFKGKDILIVNLARGSSYNAQLAALIKLSATYKDKGLIVVGVPSNDFGSSEPGTDVEIQKAYAEAKVNFPIMAVTKLTGDEEIPFYRYLTKSKVAPTGGDVHWNYTKFFVNKNGKVIARLDPDVTPDSPEMLSTVDQILAGSFKPKKSPEKTAKGETEDDDEQ
jgi:glutathione peroxidase